jgi:hypothetical protein
MELVVYRIDNCFLINFYGCLKWILSNISFLTIKTNSMNKAQAVLPTPRKTKTKNKKKIDIIPNSIANSK